MSTKEKIIKISINLFSKIGYHKTSIRKIVSEVGIKPSSFYNHFTSKEDLLDEILEYYKACIDKVKPNDEQMECIIENASLEIIFIKGFELLKESVINPLINDIMLFLRIEMYRNKKIRKFYMEWIYEENKKSSMKIFQKLLERNKIKKCDIELLATMYNAIINHYFYEYYLYKISLKNIVELEIKMKKQIELFVQMIQN